MKKLLKINLIIILSCIAAIVFCCGMSFNKSNSIIKTDSSLLFADKIGGYTTYFADSPAQRAHNIFLAAQKLNNTLVLPNQTISFNTIVGERTAARGFQEANIIVDGEFKTGVGGGVCQVSSTLYNAWITSGLDVVSAKAHSLPVSYIPMSRDATVSSSIDLVLINSSTCPVLITAKCQNASVCVAIYGKSNGFEYNIVAKLIRELAPAPPEIIYDSTLAADYEEVIKQPKAGYITYAKLQTIKNGKVISEKKLREDTYQPVRAKILRGGEQPNLQN